MIVVASTFSNNSLSELHMKYFSRTSFRLLRLDATVVWRDHTPQPTRRATWTDAQHCPRPAVKESGRMWRDWSLVTPRAVTWQWTV